MPFQIALSGVNTASTDLDITANNIANVNTTGFKRSRGNFAELFATGLQQVSAGASGLGARVVSVQQDFSQGSIDFTSSNLDLAIVGDGFNTGGLSDLQLSTADNAPGASSLVDATLNLPADAAQPPVAPLDPADPDSFNHSTSVTVFDSLGAEHTASYYFVKTANPNEWEVSLYLDGNAVGAAQTLQFDPNGALTAPATGEIAFPPAPLTNGANDIELTTDFSDVTQFGDQFAVSNLTQDGFANGRLTGIEISDEGIVFARFTNGQSEALGKVALANFANPQGLENVGDTEFAQTFESGEAQLGEAGTSNFGVIQSGALEASNVDLTAELVNMITAQRNFQANAQMISTADQVAQTVINIR